MSRFGLICKQKNLGRGKLQIERGLPKRVVKKGAQGREPPWTQKEEIDLTGLDRGTRREV